MVTEYILKIDPVRFAIDSLAMHNEQEGGIRDNFQISI